MREMTFYGFSASMLRSDLVTCDCVHKFCKIHALETIPKHSNFCDHNGPCAACASSVFCIHSLQCLACRAPMPRCAGGESVFTRSGTATTFIPRSALGTNKASLDPDCGAASGEHQNLQLNYACQSFAVDFFIRLQI